MMPRYIDADAWYEFYIERTKDLESYNHYDMGYGDAMDQVDDWLDAHPTIEARPVVRGEWISLTHCANAGVYCSVCHKKVYKEDYAWANRKNKLRSDYCPNCGADMRGEEDG